MVKENHFYKTLLIITVLVLKFGLFYNFLDPSMKSIGIISLVSVFYILFLYHALDISLKNNKIWFIIIYILINLLVIGDLIYYKYFNRYLSLGLLSQLNQLPSVSGSINHIFKPRYLIILLDLPILFFIFWKGKESKTKMRTWIGEASVVLLIFIIMFTNLHFNHNTMKVIQNREVFTYHIGDIIKSIEGYREDKYILVKPINNKNENAIEKKFFGVAKGRNLIVIQVESLQDMVINKYYEGQEITPTLNSLIKGDTIYFPNYYQQLGAGNTSDAEFVSQNSIYPSLKGQNYALFKDNYYYGLPWILKNQGYQTMALHGYKGEYWNRNKAYPYQGFESFKSEKDFVINERIGFGLPDKDFFKQSISYLKALKQPFYTFYVTLTNHGPFTIPKNHQKISLKPEHKNILFGNYLQSVHYTDEAISQFIEELKANNMYYNSVIAIYGDHFGISCNDKENHKIVSSFLGNNYDYDEMLNVPLIIHIPGENIHRKIKTTGGQIDFMPTIVNLMGVENKNPFVFGQDLVNTKEGFVASQTYMVTGSFINNDIIFEMSKDKIFENSRAWRLDTKEPVNIEEYKEDYKKSLNEIRRSNYVLENDILRYEFTKDKNIIMEVFKSIF